MENARELHLYSKFDGTCALQIEGETEGLDFTDAVQALDFIRSLRSAKGASLIVHDAVGNATLRVNL